MPDKTEILRELAERVAKDPHSLKTAELLDCYFKASATVADLGVPIESAFRSFEVTPRMVASLIAVTLDTKGALQRIAFGDTEMLKAVLLAVHNALAQLRVRQLIDTAASKIEGLPPSQGGVQ